MNGKQGAPPRRGSGDVDTAVLLPALALLGLAISSAYVARSSTTEANQPWVPIVFGAVCLLAWLYFYVSHSLPLLRNKLERRFDAVPDQRSGGAKPVRAALRIITLFAALLFPIAVISVVRALV